MLEFRRKKIDGRPIRKANTISSGAWFLFDFGDLLGIDDTGQAHNFDPLHGQSSARHSDTESEGSVWSLGGGHRHINCGLTSFRGPHGISTVPSTLRTDALMDDESLGKSGVRAIVKMIKSPSAPMARQPRKVPSTPPRLPFISESTVQYRTSGDKPHNSMDTPCALRRAEKGLVERFSV